MAKGGPLSVYLADINNALKAGNATEHTHRALCLKRAFAAP